MLYVLAQIVFFLVVAAVIGFAVGWLISAARAKTAARAVAAGDSGQLDRLKETARIARTELASKSGEVERLQEELAEKEREIETLVRELGQSGNQTAAVSPAVDRESEPAVDPLTKIRGIGPVTEALLNELGYTTFEQVANWTPEDIDRIAARKKSLRARIEREDWPRWARQRFKETRGKDLD